MTESDKTNIISNDSLDNGESVGESSQSETQHVDSNKSLTGAADEVVHFFGMFRLPSEDIRGVRIVIASMTVLSLLAAVGLGISYAAGVKQVVETGLVTSDCAPCADMGADILKKGGSAVDAIITTLLCNGLVNFHTSGIGGGGFMMIRKHKQNKSMAIDFRPSAPSAATPDLYTNSQQLEFGRLAVAVPGEIAGLAEAHKYHGTLPWKDLVKPVADLARSGFPLTLDTHKKIDRHGLRDYLKENDNDFYNLLFDVKTGQAKPAGSLVKRTSYAAALDLIAQDPRNFYENPEFVKDITDALAEAITAQDLSGYRAKGADVLRIDFNGYKLETVGSPAGGVILLHILNILKGYNFTQADSQSDLMYHRMVEAMKFGFAVYPDNVDFENSKERHNFTDELLRDGNCAEIRARITDNTTHNASYYDPHYQLNEVHGTSSAVAIDNEEVFVAAVSSLNNFFGSGIMTKKYGIVLNNDMADFDYDFPRIVPGLRVNPGNKVKAGRRPRSSISPTVFYSSGTKCGKRGAVGAAGGLRIIPGTLQYLLDSLIFQLKPSEAINRPRIANHLQPNFLYYDEGFPTDMKVLLQRKDHVMVPSKYWSVLSIGEKSAKTVDGQGDKRKQGHTTIINI